MQTIPNIEMNIKRKKVAVLSYSNIGNFGDRLGMHLIRSIMPSHAEVDFLYFKPWIDVNKTYDLLILGIGNSIFAPLLHDKLFDLVKKSQCTIGIFGTQYRGDYSATTMRKLIGNLDYWFARYEEDLELYYVPNVECLHLGDWLIKEFTLVKGTDKRLLKIGKEILKDLPLDRTIGQIQQFKKVYSERLHPLLCALMSAEEVAYKEQRKSISGQVSGKFQSMFLDIFERTYPENKFLAVDTNAVIKYRQKVLSNVHYLELLVHKILN